MIETAQRAARSVEFFRELTGPPMSTPGRRGRPRPPRHVRSGQRPGTQPMIPAENALSHARLPAVDDTRVNRTDAPPGFSVAGVDVRVQLFVIDVENELRCSAELGTADQCLLAQVSFDVADDAPTFSGSVQLTFDDAVTAEGRQVPCDFAVGTCFADAFVGTIGNVVVGAFPGVGPGATLRISVLGIDDPAIGLEPIVIQVPPIEEFQPITWDIG